ncbi:MAG: LysE/ArgO family amino acid transporter [Propionibacteriaceae bacterium]|nr:LysE/ArgO family amino acid transporter [Propionibacteriaceae bacterium]
MILGSILAGLAAGLSLIIAIGAQNIFVLRQGIARQHLAWVVGICLASDVVLIAVGTAFLERVSHLASWAIPAMTWLGFAFLVVYGLLSLRRAVTGESWVNDGEQNNQGLLPVVLTCLALTWLNPHVYLDTVILLGSLAMGHHPFHWWFASGAMVASAVWFTLLGYAARFLQPLFTSRNTWRVLDILIALVMWAIAISLVI